MRNLNLLCKNKTQADLFQIDWESYLDVNIQQIKDEVHLIRSLNQDPFALTVIVDLNIKWEDGLLEFLKKNLKLEILIIGDLNRGIGHNVDLTLKTHLQEEFFRFGITNFSENIEYSRIRCFKFLELGQSPCDLFLKIGENKFIKIINKDELFTRNIIEHYKSKNVKFFYIKREDLKGFIIEISKNIMEQLEYDVPNVEIKKEIHLASIELIHQNLTKVGISPLTIELGLKTIDSVLKQLSSTKEIWDYIQLKINSNHFLSEHSLAIAIICTAIADEMDWKSEYIKKKLVICGILHDIAFEDENLSLIQNASDAAFERLSPDKKRQYYEHPKKAIELIKNFKDLPSNVETIILEHHERPDGSGFPLGLNAQTISPLSSVLIVAEDFYHRLSVNRFDTTQRNKILEEMSAIFNKGNFRSPLNGLINIFV